MLVELRVRNLGVIDDLHLVLGPGMTALTGETGAGKTLVVGAIDLLIGGRADAAMVRPGADEAMVEGRFVSDDDTEVVLARTIPASTGRSRAYVDGRMATIAALAELGGGLVDLHGQHAHQSLLRPAVQRAALDAFGGIDTSSYDRARQRLREIEDALAALGGDSRARVREIELLRFQLEEIDAAGIDDPDEDAALEREEDLLGQATAHREAAHAAAEALHGDGGASDGLGTAYAAVRDRIPFEALSERAHALQAELDELAADLRAAAERISDDPARLAAVQDRRRLLSELRRKYGDSLAHVIAYRSEAAARLAELESHDERVRQLEEERRVVEQERAAAADALARARRRSAPKLAAGIEERLQELAMAGARMEVSVGDEEAGSDVALLIAANAGSPPLPLAKVASGGELARAMLAARLVLTGGPPTLVFDEVDAGIGGAAAVAVGRALARVATQHQVLVVTHLPQVAAFADAQVAVAKHVVGDHTVATASPVEGDGRVAELGRMLSGQPDSEVARDHAAELLDAAAAERGR